MRASVRNPDGSEAFVDLTARAAGSGGEGTFTIGADAAASAQNLTAALAGRTVTASRRQPARATATLSGGNPASATVTVGPASRPATACRSPWVFATAPARP